MKNIEVASGQRSPQTGGVCQARVLVQGQVYLLINTNSSLLGVVEYKRTNSDVTPANSNETPLSPPAEGEGGRNERK